MSNHMSSLCHQDSEDKQRMKEEVEEEGGDIEYRRLPMAASRGSDTRVATPLPAGDLLAVTGAAPCQREAT